MHLHNILNFFFPLLEVKVHKNYKISETTIVHTLSVTVSLFIQELVPQYLKIHLFYLHFPIQ